MAKQKRPTCTIVRSKKKKSFLDSFKILNFNISKACEYVKISRRTFDQWLEKDLIFKEKYDELRQMYLDDIEERLFLITKDTNSSRSLKACVELLNSLAKDRGYGLKKESEASKEQKHTTQIVLISNIPRPDLQDKKHNVIEIEKEDIQEIEYNPMPSEDEEIEEDFSCI